MSSNWPGSRPSQSSAEILPPESRATPGSYADGRMAGYDGDPQPLPPRSTRGSRWATAPATYTLVGINCAVYLAMVLRGVSPSNPSVQDLVHWGANFGGYVLAGQWWRLLSGHVIHLGFEHALLDVAGLVLMWALFARDYSIRAWLLIVTLSVIGVDAGLWLLSSTTQWYVGSSGVLHGVLAAGIMASLATLGRWISNGKPFGQE